MEDQTPIVYSTHTRRQLINTYTFDICTDNVECKYEKLFYCRIDSRVRSKSKDPNCRAEALAIIGSYRDNFKMGRIIEAGICNVWSSNVKKDMIGIAYLIGDIILKQKLEYLSLYSTHIFTLAILYVDYNDVLEREDIVRNYCYFVSEENYSNYIRRQLKGEISEYSSYYLWIDGNGILEFYDKMCEVGNLRKGIKIMWEQWSDYPGEDNHKTRVTWLPRETLEDVISLIYE